MTMREEFDKYADQFAFFGPAKKEEDWEVWKDAWKASRSAALEEAAKECEKAYSYDPEADTIAASIRALKD